MSSGAFARFRAGEDLALGVAVSEYGEAAYTAAFGVVRDPEAAETIAGNVLLAGLTGSEAPVGDPFAERLWVVAMARAQALAAIRQGHRGRFGRRRGEDAAQPVPPREGWLGEHVDADAAHAAFETLPLAARDALSLAYGAGLQPEEIGRRLGFTADEARDVLHEGLVEIEARLAGGNR